MSRKKAATEFMTIGRQPESPENHVVKNASPAVYETSRNHLVDDLRCAVKRVEWCLFYQPILSVRSGEIVGVEALIRWFHPTRGCILPHEFIPLAEDTGLILPIGEWVLETACRQVLAWRKSGYANLWLAVNISGRQFQDRNLIPFIVRTLASNNLPASALRLEITESTVMQNIGNTIRLLSKLHAVGIQTALDDFGTGYSSFSYLKQLPIQILKIDKIFLRGMGNEKNSEKILGALISLGHALGLRVVAEGVEHGEQFAYLNSKFCDEVQGHLFCRAMPSSELGRKLHGLNCFSILEGAD